MSKLFLYKQKYLKYKNKYLIHKSLFKNKNQSKYNKNLKNFEKYNKNFTLNYDKTIHELDFSHDFHEKNIKQFKLIDFIKNDSYNISEINKNPELFIKHKIMSDFSSNYQEVNLNDISNNLVVFDNGTKTYEIAQTLYYLFNLTEFTTTFIGESEKLLIQNNIEKLDIYFDFSKNQIKNEYLDEAIFIGVSLKMDEIINFNFLDSIELDVIVNELKKIYRIYNEYFKHPDTKNKFMLKFYYYIKYPKFDFLPWLYEFINNKTDEEIYQNYLNLKNNNDDKYLYLMQLIYGIKYSRDSYYLEEIKEMKKNQKTKNIIFITLDLILSFRCIEKEIKVMNFYEGKFKFLLYPKNNKIYFINNPFEMIIRGDINESIFKKINHLEKRKDLINKIMSNPLLVLELKKNKKINLKYLNYKVDLSDYSAFYYKKYYKYHNKNNIYKKEKYYKKLKKATEYCQDLINLIETLEDKIYLAVIIGYFDNLTKIINHYEKHILLNQFTTYKYEYQLIKEFVKISEKEFDTLITRILTDL